MIVGIDIGGTFTDLVSCEEGCIRTVKVPSTPSDFSVGFASALAVSESGESEITDLVHATTVATNALIQRKGARVGMITTRGFRDTLSLRRRDRRSTYGLETAFLPLIPRALRREVNERSSPCEPLVRVDPDEVVSMAESLWADGVEAILVAFLHSVTCPDNEQFAYDALRSTRPDALVFASHRLVDAPTEFERFSTSAASVYVAPLLDTYLKGISARLESTQNLQIVTSDGGLVAPCMAIANPVRTALSGPAAGVWGARAVCEHIGQDAFVACDMGGTSFDACLVNDGVPALTRDRELSFGLPLAVEMLDIATIGAGGGSVVTVSPVGTVEVGPEGMGADPGPACYGRQVHRATVADADLVLGRIASSLRLPSGEKTLDVDAARKTVNDRVARPIGVSVEEAAGLILSTVEEKMADQIRQMGIKARVDVSDHALFAYGGAGPLHATGIAQSLGISRIVIPPNAGLFSAWGGLLTQERASVSSHLVFPLEAAAQGNYDSILEEHIRQLEVAPGSSVAHEIEVGVEGSTRTMLLPVASGETLPNLLAKFESRHGSSPGKLYVTRVSTVVSMPSERSLTDVMPVIDPVCERVFDSREVTFGDGYSEICPVLDRAALRDDARGTGPCVIEERGSTTIVPPDFRWRVGPLSLLHLECGTMS